MKKSAWVKRIVLVVSSLVVLVTVIYIMSNQLGLVDSLDFGAGAYYYADMPGFEKLVNSDSFTSVFPMWIHIALFIVWGKLMYWAWKRIDRKLK